MLIIFHDLLTDYKHPFTIDIYRENSSKYDRNSVQIHTSSPAIIIQAMVDTERSNQIQTLEAIEDTALDRTVTDKSADIQDSTKDAK
jgi:flagellin-specific chaperone FliS